MDDAIVPTQTALMQTLCPFVRAVAVSLTWPVGALSCCLLGKHVASINPVNSVPVPWSGTSWRRALVTAGNAGSDCAKVVNLNKVGTRISLRGFAKMPLQRLLWFVCGLPIDCTRFGLARFSKYFHAVCQWIKTYVCRLSGSGLVLSRLEFHLLPG